ncbi:ubiquinol oxidase 2, mitochondrial-like [Panicum miliaceum]|uniref:Ubiquinol oxidase n=1 Tax=Panicum miliaceum TaxID=4540 RepID=A0A3L6Q4H4_PANMI|nr:ubiquinol oxidase 2, mitochondrial-like [Panicum miliaceum]
MSSRMAGAALLRHLGPRLFAAEPVSGLAGRGLVPAAARILPVRMSNTAAEEAAREAAAPEQQHGGSTEKPKAADGQEKKGIVSYWGIIQPPKLVKEDGTEWRWFCFRPWDTYRADTSIDMKKHHEPRALPDKLAYWLVKSLVVPKQLFFQRRHASHALLLETVAAVPGMVGGMLLHLRSLRRFEHSGGWIRALLEEAENERMHLMTFLEVAQPKWWERALVLAAQGVYFNAYFVAYLASPKFAHRFVGYLEEEAVHSYTEYLKDLEAGVIENTPAPAIAIDYWRLPADARLKDVVTVVRADEAHHRDVNHFASDIHYQGMKFKDTPAPLGYH